MVAISGSRVQPPGSEVGLYYDSRRHVDVGDELETTAGRRYLVVKVRRQERGAHIGRWHLRCIVLAPDAARDPDSQVHPVHWYRRRRRPAAPRM